MPNWAITLGDGTTTLTLTDGTNYNVLLDGFRAPLPAPRASWGGGNLFRDGGVLNERRYSNRTIILSLLIKGTSANNLVANERALYQAIERAKLFVTRGIGAQWQLTVQRPSETKSIKFDVLDGSLDIGTRLEFLSASSPLVLGASLSLICKPFGLGTAETIENWCEDPSFEVAGTALADWAINLRTNSIRIN